jgi:peptidoglycan/LPS O-acetylase OafA/YrhL
MPSVFLQRLIDCETVAERLAAVSGRPTGFDYMRLLLAVGVVALHSVIVCYGQLAEIAFWKSEARPVIRLILPMFFALSGFLVAGSLERSRTILMFLALRVIRIFPALSVEVVMSALVLGPIFTSFSLERYFSSGEFFVYFLNIVGDVHFRLPGVFDNNPHPNIVNGQLWTVPYELFCYIALTFLALLGAVVRRWAVPAAAVILSVAYAAQHYFRFGEPPAVVVGPVVGVMLIVCFLIGVSIFLYREKIAFSRPVGLFALGLSMILIAVIPYGDYFAPWTIAYATVYLGLLNPPRTVAILGADYSYGLFLYGYPIQQAVAASGAWGQVWGINLFATVGIGLLFARLSWRFVEAPALALRQPLRAIESRWLEWRGSGGQGLEKRRGAAQIL